MERTLALIKPDAVRAGNADQICDRIRKEGFRIVQRKELTLSQERAEEFYAEHKERGFFGELVEFMSSGPIQAMILEKEGAIKGWRDLMGPTSPDAAKEESPNSIRALFGGSVGENATHGSDSRQAAARELEFFFPAGIKLYYWPIRGRAIPIRLALFVGGIEFEDLRLSREETAAISASGANPFKQFPILEVDGEVMAQTNSILRYAGKLCNLYPSDPLDALTIDMVLENCEDMSRAIGSTFGLKGDELVEKRTNLYQKILPPYLKQLESTIAPNGGFILGDELTIADLKVGPLLGWLSGGILDHVPTTVLDEYAKVSRLRDAVAAHPKVVEWEETYEKK